MKKMISTVVLVALCILGCASEKAETPAEAVQSIIQLYEAGDFDSLIRTRYAEISKTESEEQVQSLIDRFKTKYQDESNRNQAIAIYSSALQVTPELSENGNVATFKLSDGFVKLSQMPNGKWGFHL